MHIMIYLEDITFGKQINKKYNEWIIQLNQQELYKKKQCVTPSVIGSGLDDL